MRLGATSCRYSIRVEAAGFRPEVQGRITITVNQNLTLNVSLQVGSASEAIEVSAQAPALSTEDAVTGQNLNRTFINDLPLVGRSVFDLALLAPGINQPAGNTFGANNMALCRPIHVVLVAHMPRSMIRNWTLWPGQRASNALQAKTLHS